MKVDRIFYCEGPDCERHARTARKRPAMFIRVTESIGAEHLFFCGWDCLLRMAAQIDPEQVIPMDDNEACREPDPGEGRPCILLAGHDGPHLWPGGET